MTIVEQSAAPVEGIQEFYRKLANILVYPKQARTQGIEGKALSSL